MYRTTILATAALVFTGCYSAPEAGPGKPTTTSASPATAEKAPTPTTEKSPAPAKSGGGFDQALADYRGKNLDRAEAGFKEVIAVEPKNADAHYYLGRIAVDRKDYEASLPYLVEATKLDTRSTEKLMTLGDAYFELKRYDTAIVQYGKASTFDDRNAQAFYKTGLTYVRLNNKIAARQQLQKLEKLDKALADKLRAEIGG